MSELSEVKLFFSIRRHGVGLGLLISMRSATTGCHYDVGEDQGGVFVRWSQ